MARNPVMLTALAVVHWNEKRLPEQRADLYESILLWLARAREQLPGGHRRSGASTFTRSLPWQCRTIPRGGKSKLVGTTRRKRVRSNGATCRRRIAIGGREVFNQEELDSGIVVSRGNEVRFWHLTFQEYFAARALVCAMRKTTSAIAGQLKLYQPDWREVVLLLGGVLHRQGPTG